MEQILTDLAGDTFVMKIAALGAFLVYALAKGLNLFSYLRDRRLQIALDALMAGINETYQSYVREIKLAREDGKLTPAERKIARQKAIEAAKVIAKKMGVDLIKAIGADFLDSYVEDLLRDVKAQTKAKGDSK